MRLPSLWKLPDQIERRLGQKRSGKQRAMLADGHLLLVLHKSPKHGKRERDGVFFWRKPDGKWESSVKGEGLFALRRHVEEYCLAEERYSEEFEQAESAEDYFRILQEVAPLHHASMSLHATLQAAREGIPEDYDIIDLRDQSYDLERTLSLLYADTKNALDYHIAKKSEEQAQISMESVKTESRLNILAAIFFPLTAIASVFGMNLRSGLEGRSIWLFWIVFLVGIILGFITREWAVNWRRKRKFKQ